MHIYPRNVGTGRAANDTAPVDEALVSAMVAERLACKMSRDFTRADTLRDELRDVCGVEVHDAERVWRVVRPMAHPPH